MENEMRENSRYSWLICFACALALFCTGGLATTGFGVYQPYLISVAGLSNTEASFIITFRNLFKMLGMPVASYLITKVEARRAIAGSLLLCGVSYIVYSLSDGFAVYCVAAALSGFSFGCGGMIPVSIIISRWFNEHRGLALGICMAATGFSTIASPVITGIVEGSSLRVAFFSEAVFMLVSAVIVYLILRSRPSCINALPIGAEHIDTAKTYAQTEAPHFLMLAMMTGVFVFGAAVNTLSTYISTLYKGAGFDSGTVAALLTVLGVALALGKCVYGQIADLIGTYKASWIMYILLLVGNALCCLADNGSAAVAAAGVILLGFGGATGSVSISIYASKVSTEQNYPRTMSTFQFLAAAGALCMGTVPGIIADRTGSYVPAYVMLLVVAVAGAVLSQMVYLRIRHAEAETVTEK